MSNNDEKLASWLVDKMLKNGVGNLTLDEIQVAANDKNFNAAYKASTFFIFYERFQTFQTFLARLKFIWIINQK